MSASPGQSRPTLADAIAELQRELAIRRGCYPKWVAARRMSQTNADHQIECMKLALENLLDLAADSPAESQLTTPGAAREKFSTIRQEIREAYLPSGDASDF